MAVLSPVAVPAARVIVLAMCVAVSALRECAGGGESK